MEDRIIELEVRVAYQDKIIADLDEVLQTFTARLQALQRELAELQSTLKNPPPSLGPATDPPPHY